MSAAEILIIGSDSWIVGGVIRRLRFWLLTCSVLCALGGFSTEAVSEEFNGKASFKLKGEYNTNLFFDENDRVSDWLTTLGMAVHGNHRTERFDCSLQGEASRLIYDDHPHLNGNDYLGQGRVHYALRPTTRVHLETGVKRETRPDRDLESTGVITRALKRDHSWVAAGVEETFTEITKVHLTGYYEVYDYPRDPEWVDSKVHGVNLRLDHNLSRFLSNTIGRIQIGLARFGTPVERTDQYYVTSGFSCRFHEKWNLLAEGGASSNQSRYRVERLEFSPPFFWLPLRETEKERGVGWLGQATLSYWGERTEGGLTFHRRLNPSTGRRGTTENTSLTLDLTHRFAESFHGRLTAAYHLNEAKQRLYPFTGTDERTVFLMPSLKYEWNRMLAVKGSYRFTVTHDRLTGSRARGNLLMIEVILNQTLFE